MSLSSYLLHVANSVFLEKSTTKALRPPKHVLIYFFKIVKGRGGGGGGNHLQLLKNSVGIYHSRRLKSNLKVV